MCAVCRASLSCRQEVLEKREKYEAKHMGGFTRIYPAANKELQEMYEKLLKGAAELFQSSFQVRVLACMPCHPRAMSSW